MKLETPPGLAYLDAALADADAHDLLRHRPRPIRGDERSFCSNDYLALATRPAPQRHSGAGASRLIAGERSEHVDLETEIARFVRLPEALAFTSGYAANVGLIAALATAGDLIVSDALNHASLIDGARLSRATIDVTPHLDISAVAAALARRPSGRAFVVTESYFSMDADAPDLRALRGLCDASGAALIVDEAHALGVLGPEGRGLCAAAGVQPDALIGTFGKAFGAAGAFVAGCPALIAWLWNRARPFVFSTGLSPAVAAAAHAGVRTASTEPWRRERVHSNAARLRAGLEAAGVPALGFGHVVPWVVGEPAAALHAAAELSADGIPVLAIRPPAVPRGTARLRFTVSAAHAAADIDDALAAVKRLVARAEK